VGGQAQKNSSGSRIERINARGKMKLKMFGKVVFFAVKKYF
jgi:hypothetical protein